MKHLMNKHVFLIGFSLLIIVAAMGQELKNVKLSKEDRTKGIVSKYESAGNAYSSSALVLYASGFYEYEVNFCMGSQFNQGTWRRSKGQLFLKDTIEKDNLPISLKFTSEKDTIGTFAISEIKNLKGEELGDGLVYINNDSTQCLPSIGACLGTFEKIDSVKIVFGNGYRSKWIKVTHHNYSNILPVLETDFLLGNYIPLVHKKYQIMDTYLKPLE